MVQIGLNLGHANRHENWNNLKDKSICLSCYWAYPESYRHIAMRQVRRIDLLWQGEEVEIYESLKQKANLLNKEISELVKEIIKRQISED